MSAHEICKCKMNEEKKKVILKLKDLIIDARDRYYIKLTSGNFIDSTMSPRAGRSKRF